MTVFFSFLSPIFFKYIIECKALKSLLLIFIKQSGNFYLKSGFTFYYSKILKYIFTLLEISVIKVWHFYKLFHCLECLDFEFLSNLLCSIQVYILLWHCCGICDYNCPVIFLLGLLFNSHIDIENLKF